METLDLAVSVLDRYLSVASELTSHRLTVAALTALFVAGKVEEVCTPEVEDCLVGVTSYGSAHIVAMERRMLAALEFRVTAPLAIRCLQRGLRACQADAFLSHLAEYVLALTWGVAALRTQLPSVAAAASLLVAREAAGAEPAWHCTLEHYTGVSQARVAQAAAAVRDGLAHGPHNGLTAVQERYALAQYQRVAQDDRVVAYLARLCTP